MWQELSNQAQKYKQSKKEADLNDWIQLIDPYLKKTAQYVSRQAQYLNLWIPEEEFYSAFLLASWTALENYCQLLFETIPLKSIVLRKLKFAKIQLYRHYGTRKQTKSEPSLIPLRKIDSLDTLPPLDSSIHLEQDCFIRLQLLDFIHDFPEEGQLIELLMWGYSPQKALQLLGKCTKYDEKYRKRIQRIRQHLKNYLAGKY